MLNIGLEAGILDERTFSMFVVHALVLTFITTPLTLLFYPARYRTVASAPKSRGADEPESRAPPFKSADSEMKTRFTLVLEKVEQLPAAMTLSQLLQWNDSLATLVGPSVSLQEPTITEPLVQPTSSTELKEKDSTGSSVITETANKYSSGSLPSQTSITIEALRLIELTYRTSAILKSQEAEALLFNDPVIAVFRSFGYLNNLAVSPHLSIVNQEGFANAVSQHAVASESEMVIIPWSRGTTSVLLETELHKENGGNTPSHSQLARNPFDGVFHRATTQDQTSSVVYSEFIRSVFLGCPSDVALFVDRGATASPVSGTQHLLLPYFGGPDDRLALSFLVQLCARSFVSAKVVRVVRSEGEGAAGKDGPLSPVSPSSPHHPPHVSPLRHGSGHRLTTMY